MMKIIITIIVWIAFSGCASKSSSNDEISNQTFVTESLESTFPDKTWESVEPEQVGFSSDGLEKTRDNFEASGGISMLVIRKGYIIADWGANEENIDSRSIRKSLFSSVIGIYQDKGVLNTGATLSELEINDMDRLSMKEQQATVANLMTSSSGIYLSAAFEEEIYREKPERESDSPGSK